MPSSEAITSVTRKGTKAAIDLYWLPLGAGGHSVRLNGKVFEAIAARLAHRGPCDLYHSALILKVPEGRFVIEQAPTKQRGRRAQRGRRGVCGQPRGWLPPPLPLRGPSLA